MTQNKLLRAAFMRRGYTDEYLNDINIATQGELQDIDDMCSRLKVAHDNGHVITVLPDFDMDGIMSGVVGYAGLAELGFNVNLFIPTPSDGYGFDSKTIRQLLQTFPSTDVILTCDVGITCNDGILEAHRYGVEVLVTDHHGEDVNDLCKAGIVVNPMKVGETYIHPSICGAVVLHRVLSRYAGLYCDYYIREQIERLCVFSGIGTVSDSMPLLYSNRHYVKNSIAISRLLYGLGDDDTINPYLDGHPVYRRAFSGYLTMLQKFTELGKISSASDINSEFYGFYLAPAFNAVKRMDGDLQQAFNVFFGSNPAGACDYLIELNNERKRVVDFYMDEISTTSQPFAPYVYISTATSGILGLLSSKLLNQTGVSNIVVRAEDNKFKGSGRAVEGHRMMSNLRENGFYSAGHDPAFGVGITDMLELKAIHAFIEHDFNQFVADAKASGISLEPSYDYIISTLGDNTGDSDIDMYAFYDYFRESRKYQPFGKGFEQPVGAVKFRVKDGTWSFMGSEKQHVKITMAFGFEIICWNSSEIAQNYKDPNSIVTVVGVLERRTFRDNTVVGFRGDFVC